MKLTLVGSLGFILFTTVTQAAMAASRTFNKSIEPLSQAMARGVKIMNTPEPTELIEFQVALKMRNFPDLQNRIATGEVISEAEMSEKYYPTATDYQLVYEWLTNQGLTIKQTYPNHLSVEVEGSVSQVEQVLSISFHAVSFEGKRYLSTFSAPSLPENVAQPVLGINHLQHYHHVYPHHMINDVSSLDSNSHYGVNQIKSAYNAATLTQSGANQKIAILVSAFPSNSDLTSFWLLNNVPQSLSNIEQVPVVSNVPPTTPSDKENATIDKEEATLDVEWSSSIAPASHVRIYGIGDSNDPNNDANVDKGYQKIINDLPTQPTLHQLSISFGQCEAAYSHNQLTSDSQLLATIASKGVTIFASSGDHGANGNICPPGKLNVDYPASDPSVTAVGGTLLNAPNGTVVNEMAWIGSGGGVSQQFCALSWQPDYTPTCKYSRQVPDVALVADTDIGGAYLVFQGQVQTVGGTSLATPIWAGFNALVNQARASKTPLGLLGPRIYKLLQTSNFRDITSGCNSFDSTLGYCAGMGYDEVTGIGVPKMDTLLPTLVSQP